MMSPHELGDAAQGGDCKGTTVYQFRTYVSTYVGFCSDLSDSSYCRLNVASQSNESLCIRMVNYSIETIIYIYIFFIVRVL